MLYIKKLKAFYFLFLLLQSAYCTTTGLGLVDYLFINKSAKQAAIDPAIAFLYSHDSSDFISNPAYLSPKYDFGCSFTQIIPYSMFNLNELNLSLFQENLIFEMPFFNNWAAGVQLFYSSLSKISYTDYGEEDKLYKEKATLLKFGIRYSTLPKMFKRKELDSFISILKSKDVKNRYDDYSKHAYRNIKLKPIKLGFSAALYNTTINNISGSTMLFDIGTGISFTPLFEFGLAFKNIHSGYKMNNNIMYIPYSISGGFSYDIKKSFNKHKIINTLGMGFDYIKEFPTDLIFAAEIIYKINNTFFVNNAVFSRVILNNIGFQLHYKTSTDFLYSLNYGIGLFTSLGSDLRKVRISYALKYQQAAGYNNYLSLDVRF